MVIINYCGNKYEKELRGKRSVLKPNWSFRERDSVSLKEGEEEES